MTKLLIKTITIKLPFWLKWTKKFIKLDCKVIDENQQLIGKTIDMLIIDEMDFIDEKAINNNISGKIKYKVN